MCSASSVIMEAMSPICQIGSQSMMSVPLAVDVSASSMSLLAFKVENTQIDCNCFNTIKMKYTSNNFIK